MNSGDSHNSRIAKNTLFLFLRMVLVMGVTLFTSRVLLHKIGITDFGIYSVIGGVIAMVSFLNTSLASGYQRFYNMSLGKDDENELQQVFSSALMIQLVLLTGCLILCETIGVWFLNNRMTIPPDRLYASNWVFQSSFIIFCFALLRVPYHGIIIAYEQMNVFAYISLVEVGAQLGLVYCLGIFDVDRFILYGWLMALVAFLVFCAYVYYARRCNRNLKFRLKYDKGLLRQLLGFSGWNIFGSMAHILRTNGVNILINMFFTPAVNAANGFATQVNGGVSGMASNVLTASNPQIMKFYAQRKYEQMLELSFNAQRYTFCLLWLMSFPVMLKIDYIFSLWLGSEVPPYSATFTVLVLVGALVEAFASPMATLVYATGKMMRYQVCVSAIIMLIIPVSYIALRAGGAPQSVFYISIAVGAAAQTARFLIVRSLIPQFSIRQFCRRVLLRAVLLVAATVAVVCGCQCIGMSALPQMLDLVAATLMTGLLCWFIGINGEERKAMILKFKSILQ